MRHFGEVDRSILASKSSICAILFVVERSSRYVINSILKSKEGLRFGNSIELVELGVGEIPNDFDGLWLGLELGLSGQPVEESKQDDDEDEKGIGDVKVEHNLNN